jgi:uncharacterized protein
MLSSTFVTEISKWVEERQKHECTGHDWRHTLRIWKTALWIHEKEGGNRLIIECAALLHDVFDWKFNTNDESSGLDQIQLKLEEARIDQPTIHSVIEIIRHISFKGAGTKKSSLSIEGQIVQDADRLDALGAIGIARAFAYGGFKNRMIYDPDRLPVIHNSFEDYKTRQSHTINHFYEKLLLLKDRMNTVTGRQIAEKRHQFMEYYLQTFLDEWNGNDIK